MNTPIPPNEDELQRAEASYAEETAQLEKYKMARKLLLLAFLAAELLLGLFTSLDFCVIMAVSCVGCWWFLHEVLPDKEATSTSAGAKTAFVIMSLGIGITLTAQILTLTVFPIWICLLVYGLLYIVKMAAPSYLENLKPDILAAKSKKKQYEDKKKQYEEQKGQYETAKKYLNEAAAGNAEAQFELANLYAFGQGVTKDMAEAAKWYRASAEQGFAKAQTSLGICYCGGGGVTHDYAEALKWFKKAAEQGFAAALWQIGKLYQSGKGVENNAKEAARWYMKAAEQGFPRALSSMGDMYRLGAGVETDLNEAAQWYKKAAEQGDAWGQYQLGMMFRDGWYRGRHKIQSFAEAEKWMRKAAEQGDPKMQYSLAYLYKCKRDDKDETFVSELWDEFEALYRKNDDSYEYEYVYRTNEISLSWFRKAAEQGMLEAQLWLIQAYYKGDFVSFHYYRGIHIDYTEAAKWAKKAAEQGSAKAMYFLGRLMLEKNKTNEALTWFLKAARLGCADASERLAVYYEKGSYGVEKDLMKAADFKNLAEGQRLAQGR